ncbi:MAG: penicillin-binding protein 1C, partial [Cyanobacteria bacterium J06650_10]
VEEYISLNDLSYYERLAEQPFQLSSVYDEWLASQPDLAWTTGSLTGNIRILTPREDAYFVAGEGSRLAFEIASPSGEMVEWRLNGELLATTDKNEIFWPMEEGEWVLEVKRGEMGDRVRFQVRSPEASSAKRGFSVVD